MNKGLFNMETPRVARLGVCVNCLVRGFLGLPEHMQLVDIQYLPETRTVEFVFASPFAPKLVGNRPALVEPVYDDDGNLIEIQGMDT